MKTALIAGLTGQDGSYLSEELLGLGYKVVGIIRRSSTDNLQNLSDVIDNENLILEYGDLTDQGSIDRIFNMYTFDEVYNLGAMSFVPVSWKSPEFTFNVNALGHIRILESVRRFNPESKVYFAGTSEMFGKVRETPQTEKTPFYPRSPYGIAKVAGFWSTINYRESYNLFACNGILFNHESVRRPIEFVTRKVTDGVAKIACGLQKELRLGNLDSKRDWGHSKDYISAMILMLQQDIPDDFVVGMGETHTIRELCQIAFDRVGLDYEKYVVVDPKFYRPAEVDILLSDSSKARKVLGWKPKYTFEMLINEMVDHDLSLIEGSLNE